MLQYIQETAAFLKDRGFDQPEVGIILGTGLGKLLEDVEIQSEVSYNHLSLIHI